MPKPRPLKPDRIRSEPLEPTSTNDVILDTRARITYRTEKEVWDAEIEEYTSNMIVYNELLKSWAVYEESTRRKFPQVYIKIHNHLSKESKDLIERTCLTTFKCLNKIRLPIQFMEMINTTHSTEYTGIPANDQYQVALRIFTARKGPEEPPSQ